MNPIEFADRLFARLTGKLSEGEARDVDAAVDSRADLKRLVRQLDDKEYIREQIEIMDGFDADSAWAKVSSRIQPSEAEEGEESRGRVWRWWIAAAASLAVIFTLGLSLWTTEGEGSGLPAAPVLAEDIRTAISDSEEHGLTGAVVEETTASASLNSERKAPAKGKASVSDGHSSYEEIMKATRVTTFYNKEYWLTLSDNTVVHLARNTRIVFPERFGKDSREVYLSGEAYFIVTPDKNRRFVIHTDAAETIVYGTELNVTTRDGTTCRVALVTGSAGVKAIGGSGGEQMLIPGEEATVDDGKITVGEADLPVLKAWNSGHVEFNDWPLSRLMEVIGRWYGKEARFDTAAFSSMEISGSFDRYDELSSTIESLATVTGAEIRVDDTSITVK